MTAEHEGKISKLLPADRDVDWCACCASCDASAPTITVWTEGGELHVSPGRWYPELMPATAGHLFLAGIPLETVRKGQDTELTTSPDRLDDVVTVLHEAGADVTVMFDHQIDADAFTSRLGGHWRQR